MLRIQEVMRKIGLPPTREGALFPGGAGGGGGRAEPSTGGAPCALARGSITTAGGSEEELCHGGSSPLFHNLCGEVDSCKGLLV